MKIKLKSDNSILLHILLVLSCMNFLGRGSIVFFIFSLFTLFGTQRLRVKMDAQLFFVLLFGFSTAISLIIRYDLYEVIKSLNYILLYIIGNSCYQLSQDKPKYIKRVLFSGFLGFDLYIIVTWIYNINISGEYGRQIFNCWTGTPMSVTLVGLLASVVIGYSFYAIFLQPKKLLKLFAVISLIVMFLVNIQTATRTPFVMFAVMYIFIGALFYINKNKRYKLQIILSVVVVIVAMAVVYISDIGGIRSFIESSPVYNRFKAEGIATSRGEIIRHYLEHAFDHLWGGGNIYRSYGSYAHFFVLDGHDHYGILATVALIGLTVGFISNIVKFIKLPQKNNLDYLFISMYTTMLIQCCLEPVFEGYPILLMYLILIHGIATSYILERKKGLLEKV